MSSSLKILLFVLGVMALGPLLWIGLTRAEATDRPLERLAIRVGLSVLVLVTIGGLLRLLFQAGAGSFVAGFGLAAVIAGMSALLGYLLALIWVPEVGALVSRPFTSLFLGSDEAPEPASSYALAETRRKQGRHAEAIKEIRAQLARSPDDPAGWFLLADIQMENLRDFDQATATLREFLSRQGLSPQTVIMGRLRLADWHVKHRQDFESARVLLKAITEEYPDVPQARLAQQRLMHLDELEGFSAGHSGAVPMGPAADPRLGLHAAGGQPESAPANEAAEIDHLLSHLEQFPLDREAREKLALGYAREQHRLDLCAEQIEHLLGLPDARPSEIVRWLHLLADVYIKEGHDVGQARATLERVVSMFPGSALAAQAAQRIGFLGRELHAAEARKAVKLGSHPPKSGQD